MLSLAMLLMGAGTIYLAERGSGERSISSFGEALWYSVVTMTTVGYGDLTPHTMGGRMVAVVLMLGGMGLLSLFTATIASTLVTQRIRSAQGLEVVERMRDHLLLCGWNQHTELVVEGLLSASRPQVVIINEFSEEVMSELIRRHRGVDIAFVHGDAAIEAVLDRANARHAQSAIVLADTSNRAGLASDERTTLVTLAIKSLRANIKVTAEALDLRSETHLRRAGADDVVITGEFNGFLLSGAATTPGLSEVVRSLLSRTGGGLSFRAIPTELRGRTFGEVFPVLHRRDAFLPLAIVTATKGLTLDDLLTDDQSLVDQFIKRQFAEAGMDFLRFEEGGVRVQVNPGDDYVIGEFDSLIGIQGKI